MNEDNNHPAIPYIGMPPDVRKALTEVVAMTEVHQTLVDAGQQTEADELKADIEKLAALVDVRETQRIQESNGRPQVTWAEIAEDPIFGDAAKSISQSTTRLLEFYAEDMEMQTEILEGFMQVNDAIWITKYYKKEIEQSAERDSLIKQGQMLVLQTKDIFDRLESEAGALARN